MVRACVAREFATFALDRTSPVIGWLRRLAADAHQECGGPGVGAVGMCLTGGFALAMMIDDVVQAPVLSQPSLPLPLVRSRRGALGLSDADLGRVKERVAGGACVLGLRFTDDSFVPGRTVRGPAPRARRRLHRRRDRLVARQPVEHPEAGALGADERLRRRARTPDPRRARPGASPSSPSGCAPSPGSGRRGVSSTRRRCRRAARCTRRGRWRRRAPRSPDPAAAWPDRSTRRSRPSRSRIRDSQEHSYRG